MKRGSWDIQRLASRWQRLKPLKYWVLVCSMIVLLIISGKIPATASDVSIILAQDGATLTPTQTLIRPTLKAGSQGTEVAELQATLKLLGYYNGSVDGVYSEETAKAVSAFQKAAGLTTSGIVDQQTWNRLFPPNPGTQESATTCVCPESATASQRASRSSTNNSKTQSVSFPIVQLGMRGDAITGLQERLQAKGFLQSPVDGVFGVETQAAVQAAQTEYELKPDGIVGIQTWLVLLR